MPTSDAQNLGFIPGVWQTQDPVGTQDPVTTNDQNQTSAFDFSLDLPDSFPTYNEESQAASPVAESVVESVPPVQEIVEMNSEVSPTEPMMDFLHEDSVEVNENLTNNFDQSEDDIPAEWDQRIVSIQELPLDTGDFAVEPVLSDVDEREDWEDIPSHFNNSFETEKASCLSAPEDLVQSNENFMSSNVEQEQFSSKGDELNLNSHPLEPVEASNQPLTSSTQPSDTFDSLQTQVSVEMPHSQNQVPDPFEAMKASLNQNLAPEPQAPIAAPEPQVPQLETPAQPSGMLSLDEMIAQPVATSVPTMSLDAMVGTSAPAAVNPLSNPMPYPPITQPQNQPANWGMAKIVAVFGVVGLLVAVGFMAFLKYPNEIQSLFGWAQTPVIQTAQLTGEQEHGSAELTGESLTGDMQEISDEETSSDTEESSDVGEVTLDETQAESSDDVQEVVLWGDETSDQESTETEQKSEESQLSTSNSGETSTSGDQAVDALGAVESIVGEVGANETLTQQIESFKLKAQQIADTGKAQGDRMMLKYGIYVVNQVKKVQDDLANGQKMSISEWNTLKTELELSLAKAQNGGN